MKPPLWICMAALAAFLYWFDPAETPLYPPCLVRLYTGLSCPGCGATRALHALLHLRLDEAWRLNPLWTAGAPALAVWGLWRALRDHLRRAEA